MRQNQRGFSLIELIIVIVILGILIAIAIPVYNNIQNNAKDKALQTAAANGASEAVAALANDGDMTVAQLNTAIANLAKGDVTSVTVDATHAGLDNMCVKATDGDGGRPDAYAGPGAKADGSGCE